MKQLILFEKHIANQKHKIRKVRKGIFGHRYHKTATLLRFVNKNSV